ncbi:hypothetical protein JW998_06345, partial [candidate division KSB1 bacterium]|nr:hypothetical protein [candidate division KSB1 bacterium]
LGGLVQQRQLVARGHRVRGQPHCRLDQPRTGQFAAGGVAGTKKLTAPSEEPWVLLVGRKSDETHP